MPETETAAADSAALSIVQSRDASLAEGKLMTVAAVSRLAAAYRGDPLYWALQIAAAVALTYAIVSLVVIAVRIEESNFQYTWIMAALILGGGALFALPYRMRAAAAKGNIELLRAGNRYTIDGNGLEIAAPEITTRIRWDGIQDVSSHGPIVAIRISSVQVLALPKAALDSEGAESFCAELERRWRSRYWSQVAAGLQQTDKVQGGRVVQGH